MRHRIGEYKFICLKETSLFAKDYLHKLFNSEIYQAFKHQKSTKNECIQIVQQGQVETGCSKTDVWIETLSINL